MKKKEIVKNTWEFEDIIKTGTCLKNQYFIIHLKENNLMHARYGISVSKKIGNAVTRNYYKRKIRTIIDNYKKQYNNKVDYIIILRKRALELKHNQLQQEFFNLMCKKGSKANGQEKK